jgi:hypothetical protein
LRWNWLHLALGAAAVLVASPARAQSSRPLPPAPPDVARLSLPPGELVLFNRTDKATWFLDRDRTHRVGDSVELWSLTIYRSGIDTGYGRAVQLVERYRMDCVQRFREGGAAMAYDEQGRVVMWLPDSDERLPIERDTAGELVRRVLCEGAPAPTRTVNGHAAALAMGRPASK